MIWRNVQYDWPEAAFLLIFVLPLIWGFFFLYQYRKDVLDAFADRPVLDTVIKRRIPTIFWIKAFLYCLAWVFGVIALAQPKGNEHYITSTAPAKEQSSKQVIKKGTMRQRMHEVIFLFDVSASMGIADMQGKKSREEVVKEIVDGVISRLQGENVSLMAFTSATMQIVPSTLDYLFSRLMLQQVQINEGETEGTNLEQALDAVRKQYFSTNSSSTKTLVILTDGGDTRLEGLEGEKRRNAIDEIIKPILEFQKHGGNLLVIGIGSVEGKNVPGVSFQGHSIISSLDEPLLRKLSLLGQGELIIVDQTVPFLISQRISKAIARSTSFVDASEETSLSRIEESPPIYDFYFQIPLGIALMALIGCVLIPDTMEKGQRFNIRPSMTSPEEEWQI